MQKQILLLYILSLIIKDSSFKNKIKNIINILEENKVFSSKDELFSYIKNTINENNDIDIEIVNTIVTNNKKGYDMINMFNTMLNNNDVNDVYKSFKSILFRVTIKDLTSKLKFSNDEGVDKTNKVFKQLLNTLNLGGE